MGLSTEFSRVNNRANLQVSDSEESNHYKQATWELVITLRTKLQQEPTVSEISSMALIISGDEGIPDM